MVRSRFAGYPAAVAFPNPDGKKPVSQLRWGFWVLDKGERKGSYRVKDVHGTVQTGKYVRCRMRGRKEDCWIREHELQDERCLEVIFVDIGQGDGCLVVTPDDHHMVIDAGVGDNMYRFLKWRYGGFKKKLPHPFDAVISHPDSDHYLGFEHLFADPNVEFGTIYTNGLMERFAAKSADSLGGKKKVNGKTCLMDLITSKQQFETFLKDKKNWEKTSRGRISNKQFPTMLKKALDAKSFKKLQMLSVRDKYMPGYEENKELSIQVLGPVPEPGEAKPHLRWLSSLSKTKNGHSVVLRLQYRNVSMMLGGDLNIPSENLLLSHHTGMKSPPEQELESAFVASAQETFQVDIAKSCHHGSSDFTPWFLRTLNPIATVISSGDDEPHSHPRADTLGTIGLHSRANPRPLIFSTELARSAKEAIKHPNVVRRDLKNDLDAILKAPATTAAEKKRRDKLVKEHRNEMEAIINRSVAVYGAINVVTDGHKVVLCQKLERSGGARQWDIYRLEPPEGQAGPLCYKSKH